GRQVIAVGPDGGLVRRTVLLRGPGGITRCVRTARENRVREGRTGADARRAGGWTGRVRGTGSRLRTRGGIRAGAAGRCLGAPRRRRLRSRHGRTGGSTGRSGRRIARWVALLVVVLVLRHQQVGGAENEGVHGVRGLLQPLPEVVTEREAHGLVEHDLSRQQHRRVVRADRPGRGHDLDHGVVGDPWIPGGFGVYGHVHRFGGAFLVTVHRD